MHIYTSEIETSKIELYRPRHYVRIYMHESIIYVGTFEYIYIYMHTHLTSKSNPHALRVYMYAFWEIYTYR